MTHPVHFAPQFQLQMFDIVCTLGWTSRDRCCDLPSMVRHLLAAHTCFSQLRYPSCPVLLLPLLLLVSAKNAACVALLKVHGSFTRGTSLNLTSAPAFFLLQRDELKCPSLPNACSCTSAGSGEPGVQGPVVSLCPD